MSKIYLVNIGANTSDRSRARCPLFPDGTWIYVPYSYEEKGTDGFSEYPKPARPYIRNMAGRRSHNDPDWDALTYGDNCSNPRAQALRRIDEDDILLFWALLWPNADASWGGFSGDRRWCFIGALRVREVLTPGERPEDATNSRVERARRNAHFGDETLEPGHHVFIGCTKHSQRFDKAVDLQINNRAGLLYRTIRTAKGTPLTLNGAPTWYSSLRTSRPVWNLDLPEECERAVIARDAILRDNGFDMLAGL